MQNIKRASLTEGPIFSKMLLFALPVILTGILQLLYNSADSIIVGRYSGDPNALGAVGSTGTVTGLLLNMFMGLATGASVLVSQFYGAKNERGVSRTVHTSVTVAVIGGIVLTLIGELVASPLLTLLDTKPALFDSALLYIRIIFLGAPAAAVFNFGAAAIRSLGDSRTPLIILAASGVVNVLLNLVFVIGAGMSVAGVALATVISQFLSAVGVIVVLMRTDGPHRFSFKEIGVDFPILQRMLKIAIPSAIQSSLFSVSNMILQSSINSFSTDAVSGIAVGATIESYIYTTLNSFYTVTITFVGQNYGAHKPRRTKKIIFYSLLQIATIGVLLAALITAFLEPLTLMFVDPAAENTAAIVDASVRRCEVCLFAYVFCGSMEATTGFLRGYGYSVLPMASSVLCICVFRAIWALLIFPNYQVLNTIEGLFIIYPITWIMATVAQGIMVAIVYKKKRREFKSEV